VGEDKARLVLEMLANEKNASKAYRKKIHKRRFLEGRRKYKYTVRCEFEFSQLMEAYNRAKDILLQDASLTTLSKQGTFQSSSGLRDSRKWAKSLADSALAGSWADAAMEAARYQEYADGTAPEGGIYMTPADAAAAQERQAESDAAAVAAAQARVGKKRRKRAAEAATPAAGLQPTTPAPPPPTPPTTTPTPAATTPAPPPTPLIAAPQTLAAQLAQADAATPAAGLQLLPTTPESYDDSSNNPIFQKSEKEAMTGNTMTRIAAAASSDPIAGRTRSNHGIAGRTRSKSKKRIRKI
jgi:uncharacterized protein YktA (UPF0223 family)